MKQFRIFAVTASLAALSAVAQEASSSSAPQDERSKQRQGQQQQQQPSSSSTESGQSSVGAPASTQSGQSGQYSTQPGQRPGQAPIQAGQEQRSSGLGAPSGQTPGQAASGTSATGQQRYGTQTGQASPSQAGQQRYGTQTGQTPTSQSGQQPFETQPGQSGISAQGTSPGGQVGQANLNVQVNQQHVTQLTQAFGTMRTSGANNTQQLKSTITAIAPAGRASSQFVSRFVTDLGAVLPTVTLAAPAQQRLATAIAYVMSPTVEVTQLEPVLTQVRHTLVEAGVSPLAAQTVACDLHLIAAEAHPNLIEVKVNP